MTVFKLDLACIAYERAFTNPDRTIVSRLNAERTLISILSRVPGRSHSCRDCTYFVSEDGDQLFRQPKPVEQVKAKAASKRKGVAA